MHALTIKKKVTSLQYATTYNLCLDAVENGDKYEHVKRKTRVVSELCKLQEQSILEFCHSEGSLTIDSNSKLIVKVKVDGVEEEHVGRVWLALTIYEKYLM